MPNSICENKVGIHQENVNANFFFDILGLFQIFSEKLAGLHE